MDVGELLRALGEVRRLPPGDPDRRRVEHAALALVRDGQRHRKRDRRRATAAADGALLATTPMGSPARVPDAPLPAPASPGANGLRDRALPPYGSRGDDASPAGGGTLRRERRCYVCKEAFTRVGEFYHLLCPGCAAVNLARRAARADLRGRRALVTGGRVKIGHHVALKLLRDGAHVTVTTRFPRDAAERFAAAGDWAGRLEIVGIDLRDPRQVLGLTGRLLDAGDPLDILVNNAAQTLRHPPSAYAALVEGERRPPVPGASVSAAPGFAGLAPPHEVPPAPAAPADGIPVAPPYEIPGLRPGVTGAPEVSPVAPGVPDVSGSLPDVSGLLPDVSGLLPDGAARNSWSARIGQVGPVEVLEAQLVNAVAPFLLLDRLLPLLLASPRERRYVVNVSAMEGVFAMPNKTGRHPHTNMAKAALNMLTRTSAADLAERGVYLCSVDTGWITDEVPAPLRAGLDRRTPLDVIDGASRVYDPIVRGEAGDPVHGVLLKDYREAPW
ncbi:SDR family NAD(P)-dependent oxidoreductase [Bailinhaonella thermotolerans]|uniref:SDR family NAD(P)-dependent oxidoreductase n=1 Tax=Bailinhaonella thermotolerans TaxID=1070861 RepID=A0A3A4B2U4_9ACTN|nr:SDR family NAD(P)-dependent oxidoreductase [Bailinhaonella thermotolerans]RJL32495.1 SDR family NAD(P)-dependent oxidoreductase [Bailinhaonella thermotolerans]